MDPVNVSAKLAAYSRSFTPNLCDPDPPTPQTGGHRRTDDMQSQYALCTKVHRAVKITIKI